MRLISQQGNNLRQLYDYRTGLNVCTTGTYPLAVQKYSGKGGFKEDAFTSLGVPEHLAPTLEWASNHGLAATSWKTYGTAERHLQSCIRDVGRNMEFPFSVGDTLTFIGWLVEKRGVKAKTIQIYLSGLRMAHFQRGLFDVNLYADIVRHVLTGLKQVDLIKAKKGDCIERLPVTMEVMEQIKLRLLRCGWNLEKKRLVWAVVTMAFSGSFRIHELLSREAQKFDPPSTLLAKDISREMVKDGNKWEKVIKVYLKSPKERRLKMGLAIDVFPTDSYLCPVGAYGKYLRSLDRAPSPGGPAFLTKERTGYTGAAFNKDLKELLKGHIDYSRGKITSHSFRAGLATEMGKLGYKDEEIKAVGRWSSEAYLHYVKCARLKRMKVAKQLATSLLVGRRISS